MNKQEVQKRVLQNGKPLALDKFEWDEKEKIFSSGENDLIIDFASINGITFNTESNCVFKTESYCRFNTNYNCQFNTGADCVFNTGTDCIFKTKFDCQFNTGSDCVFDTGSTCVFNTGSDCVVVRKDIYEIIELEAGVKIKLNNYCIKGYEEIKEQSEDIEITF